MNPFFPHYLSIAAALVVTTGIATAASVTEIKTYQSTLSTDAQGALDLKMEVNYNNAASNAPVMVMTHQYSDSPDLFNQVRPVAQHFRDQGFFAITVAMRGRMGSDGVRDSGGLEIYDIFDAVEAAKTQYGNLINPNNISITGYSGGGGNAMSALTKFPDYFRTGSAFYGMSDYGYDTTKGWYNNGAGGRTWQLDADIGNPNSPTALITSRYLARASNLASRNNPYSEIHFLVNSDEGICPPINSTSYRDNAVATASFTGEFNKITVHIGAAGTYQDFNGNGINEANEQQYWPHSTLSTTDAASGTAWYVNRVLNGSIAAPVLNASDDLFVAGFVRTKKFSFFIGDGQNGAGSLVYTLSTGVKTFTFDLQSTYAVTGRLTVDTADMSGQTVHVLRNGVLSASFTGGGTYQVAGIVDNETVRLEAMPEPKQVARYAFEGNALDSGGHGFGGTATALTYVAGKIDAQAAQFNGSGANVTIPPSVSDDYTVAMWVMTTDTAGGAGGQWWSGKGLVDGEIGGGGADWGTSIVNGKFVLGVGSTFGDTTIASSVNVNDGTWHHLAATRDNATGAMQVYVDGVLRGSGAGPTGPRTWPTLLRIGALQPGSNFLNGTLDDVRLYNHLLTASEIAILAAGQLAAPQNVTATPGSSTITLSWSAVPDATDYIIQRATDIGGPFTDFATGIQATSYVNSGLDDGATWYYKVAARGLHGTGVASAPLSTTTYTSVESWRFANFGTIGNSANAADEADPDGDGWLNKQEYISGTNPNDPTSLFKIDRLQVIGNDMIISFPTLVERTYRVERSYTLATGSWVPLPDVIAGTGEMISVTDPNGAENPRRFYKLVATR